MISINSLLIGCSVASSDKLVVIFTIGMSFNGIVAATSLHLNLPHQTLSPLDVSHPPLQGTMSFQSMFLVDHFENQNMKNRIFA